jgi:hypothetical protein
MKLPSLVHRVGPFHLYMMHRFSEAEDFQASFALDLLEGAWDEEVGEVVTK